MRVVTTALPHPVRRPVPRPLGGVPEVLLDAVVPVEGADGTVERLRNPETLVVTTGQQPGLFTGPLYTVYKALSAAVLARELEQRWTRPVVPVFWVASDDHDFAEARWASWLSTEGEVVTAALPERPADAPLTSLSREALGAVVTDLLDQLEGSLPASPARDETLAWLRRHYVADATVGGSFAGALAELLAPFGVLCLDGSHPALKRAAAPLVLRALELAAPLDRALAARVRALEAEGHHVTVTVGDGATLAFIENGAGRDRLLRTDGGFVTRRAGERFDLDTLARVAEREPERLSANVLLRPVIESALLPTVAYVAGPGELAYLPVCLPVYQALEVPPQTAVPRWSGVVVEPRVDRVLGKFGAGLEELTAPGQVLEARVVRSQVPPELNQAIERLRRVITAEYEAILPAVTAIDPTLERPTGATRQQALSGLEGIEKKVRQHLRKREATELAQIARARATVLPGGRPQERVFTAAGWLGRYGRGFLDDVLAAITAWYAGALAGRAGRT
jgi:bacillithiol biosynthesis cysteine-adding enzyme BshC